MLQDKLLDFVCGKAPAFGLEPVSGSIDVMPRVTFPWRHRPSPASARYSNDIDDRG